MKKERKNFPNILNFLSRSKHTSFIRDRKRESRNFGVRESQRVDSCRESTVEFSRVYLNNNKNKNNIRNERQKNDFILYKHDTVTAKILRYNFISFSTFSVLCCVRTVKKKNERMKRLNEHVIKAFILLALFLFVFILFVFFS